MSPRYPESAVITLRRPDNPKSGASADRFALYRSGMTVGEYLDRCHAIQGERNRWRADLAWDVERGFISVSPTQAELDCRFLDAAYDEAQQGLAEGGIPIGSVLVRNGEIIGRGHNRRVQKGDPILHGEMDAIQNAGRQKTYKDVTCYTTLSPCMMCTGTIIQFGISRVVVAESKNFKGFQDVLALAGVDVTGSTTRAARR